MYCESAQKDCPYLDEVDLLRQNSVVFRATESKAQDIEDALAVEAIANNIIEKVPERAECSQVKCALISMAVRNSVLCTATNLAEKNRQAK